MGLLVVGGVLEGCDMVWGCIVGGEGFMIF